LLRSAVAFGFDGVILGDGCVDLYNEKVIRSTQGAIFKLPILNQNLEEAVTSLKEQGVRIYGTSLQNGRPLNEIEETMKMAFILGNEGSGVSKELLSLTDGNIFIEMSENIESLNVSIAGSIIMYRFRQ
ncbi:MAG: TrmH family RNA methyltransferase, partial [Turicibacter sanguinis]